MPAAPESPREGSGRSCFPALTSLGNISQVTLLTRATWMHKWVYIFSYVYKKYMCCSSYINKCVVLELAAC